MTYSDDDLNKILNQFGNPKIDPFDQNHPDYKDNLSLTDIIVYNQRGDIVEMYDEIIVPKEPLVMYEMGGSVDYCQKSIIQAEQILSKDNKFLPSSQLLSTIMGKMFNESITFDGDDIEIINEDKYNWIKKVMKKDRPLITNSIMNYDNMSVKHYPLKDHLENHSDGYIQNSHNSVGSSYTSFYSQGFSVWFHLTDGDLNQADENFLDATIGEKNKGTFHKLNEHFESTFRALPSQRREGTSAISLGRDLNTNHDIDNIFQFTYCQVPNGGVRW